MDDEIHLMSGICPEWLEDGSPVGIKGLRTSLGRVDVSLCRKKDAYTFSFSSERKTEKALILHLPDGDGGTRTVHLTPATHIRQSFDV